MACSNQVDLKEISELVSEDSKFRRNLLELTFLTLPFFSSSARRLFWSRSRICMSGSWNDSYESKSQLSTGKSNSLGFRLYDERRKQSRSDANSRIPFSTVSFLLFQIDREHFVKAASSVRRRITREMILGYERWRDGVGV